MEKLETSHYLGQELKEDSNSSMCQLQDPIFKSQKLNISLVATT
jgi:hypothetical protein